MKKLFVLCLLIGASLQSAVAQEGDLVLQGEKWIAKFNKFVCSDAGVATAAPKAFTDLNIAFEQITTDSTLDNGLVKATFVEEGSVCRYSAILFADNAAKTIRLVESKAFSPEKSSECANGKAVLDAALESNDYLYYGHPHNLAIMVPVNGAEAVCEGSSLVGVNFIVSGRIR